MCSIFGLTGWLALGVIYLGCTAINYGFGKLFQKGLDKLKGYQWFQKVIAFLDRFKAPAA